MKLAFRVHSVVREIYESLVHRKYFLSNQFLEKKFLLTLTHITSSKVLSVSFVGIGTCNTMLSISLSFLTRVIPSCKFLSISFVGIGTCNTLLSMSFVGIGTCNTLLSISLSVLARVIPCYQCRLSVLARVIPCYQFLCRYWHV